MEAVAGVLVVLVFFALIALGSSVRILREYERGVIFRLGRLIAQKGPGLILLVPPTRRIVRRSARRYIERRAVVTASGPAGRPPWSRWVRVA